MDSSIYVLATMHGQPSIKFDNFSDTFVMRASLTIHCRRFCVTRSIYAHHRTSVGFYGTGSRPLALVPNSAPRNTLATTFKCAVLFFFAKHIFAHGLPIYTEYKKCTYSEKVSCKVTRVIADLIDYYKLRLYKVKCKKL